MKKINNPPNCEVVLKGLSFIVKSGVFLPEPTQTYSTLIYFDNLPDVAGKIVADIGCGCGAIGIYCLLKKAKKVVASDVLEVALENTKENAIKFNVEDKIKIVKSNLFENIKEKFDYIFANLPISSESWGIDTQVLLKKFLSDCTSHLKKNGKVYFVWISSHDTESVRRYLVDEKFNFKEIKASKLNRVYSLFEVSF
jgi:release factor glutamine methyltransferase